MQEGVENNKLSLASLLVDIESDNGLLPILTFHSDDKFAKPLDGFPCYLFPSTLTASPLLSLQRHGYEWLVLLSSLLSLSLVFFIFLADTFFLSFSDSTILHVKSWNTYPTLD